MGATGAKPGARTRSLSSARSGVLSPPQVLWRALVRDMAREGEDEGERGKSAARRWPACSAGGSRKEGQEGGIIGP